jgi:predicted AAA+ superfamily ATPase
MALQPWREIAVPHEDVLKGTFQQAEFAADLSRVHAGTATDEYQDPVLFFQRTFITEGMRLLLDSVVKRLTGRGGDPVIQLQTAFGGGKTHTMLAVYHLARGEVPARALPGIPPIVDSAQVPEMPSARVVVLDGNTLAPNMPQQRGRISVHTLWGELAWQLGTEDGYTRVKDADTSGTSPGKEVLTQLLAAYAPCVILMDELVAYIRQFDEGKTFSGGTYDANLSFLQALTEALKAVPTAVLLASLPESDKEAGSQRGINALRTLEHYFARVQALWKPVAAEEAFEIVRRRLFTSMTDRQAAATVCRAYADFYVANSADVPHETQESRYYERLMQAYPIHPEVFDRLYEDWSTLDSFQRTRGVLKLMAKVIYRLWNDGNNDLLIMPGSLPLYDADTRNEAIYYLPPGWDPVLDRDIDGERAETTALENRDTRLGAVQACRRAARTVFLGSAPTTPNQMVRGIETERVVLGCVQPGQQTGVFKDALRRLSDHLHYLNSANNRVWFDTRPNLRREMEERKRRFQDTDDVVPAIRERLQQSCTTGVFGGIHVFTPSSDVPDDWSLRLVVLPPDAPFSRQEARLWQPTAEALLKRRGEQPRHQQNRLLFLAAEYDSVARLKDQVRTLLAWQSIVTDYRETRIVLDNLMARNAEAALTQAHAAVQRMIRETYKWVLAPMQEARPGTGVSDLQWEACALTPNAPDLTQEIVRVVKDNELLITDWAPIHLAKMLHTWFWKPDVPEVSALDVWWKTCQYLYLPRLRDDTVFRAALAAGTGSRDFFGMAYGKEDARYIGFTFGEAVSPVLDSTLLVIDPHTASAYADAQRAAVGADRGTPPLPPDERDVRPALPVKRHFYGKIDLDPIRAKIEFATLVDAVVLPFTARPEVQVNIAIEIRAESPTGFDEKLQRDVKENCNVLHFQNAEFEKGEEAG